MQWGFCHGLDRHFRIPGCGDVHGFGGDGVVEMSGGTGSDQDGVHSRVLEHPADGQPQGWNAHAFSEVVQLIDNREVLFAEIDVRVPWMT